MRFPWLMICTLLTVTALFGASEGALTGNFYKESCPQAEAIVKRVVWRHVSTNRNVPAKLLRMHFHDCFVRGCDGSVLLNSTSSGTAEKAAVPNLSMQGFDIIDEAKEQLETACPRTVSCADILAVAARDSVSFQFKKPLWKVPTGRRDGRVSRASEALANIPTPLSNFTALKQSFASKGLNIHDLVALSGGHTIGVSHCNFFSNRLYNFTGRGDADPSLNPAYAGYLRSRCRSPADNTTTVEMDQGNPQSFNSNYYVGLSQNKGMFQSDAALLTNRGARRVAAELVQTEKFYKAFALSMRKLGAVGVLTGTAGEIRKNCARVN